MRLSARAARRRRVGRYELGHTIERDVERERRAGARHRCSDQVWVAEELAELVSERIDVVGERAGGEGVVEVADDVSRGCGVVEEVLEDGSGDRERHASSIARFAIILLSK
jgi:hypothetical protein